VVGSANTGSGDADSYIRIESSDTGEQGIEFYHDATHLWTIDSGDAADNDLRFSVGPASTGEKVRIDTDGKVGIGTTSPGSMLHIYSGQNLNTILESTGSGPADGPVLGFARPNGGASNANFQIELRDNDNLALKIAPLPN